MPESANPSQDLQNGHLALANARADRRTHAYLILVLSGLMSLSIMACQDTSPSAPPVRVGLIAPLSGPLATPGEALQRGILLAMEEVNRDGGVLGRPLELVVRDVQNDPQAGVAALRELVQQHAIMALVGGVFSPVMLAQLDAIHALQIPLINAMGSVTSIIQNGRTPNYAFRTAMSDAYADEFLVRYALEVMASHHPGILADTSAWGDSNVAGLRHWLAQLGTAPVGVERFDQGDTNMRQQLVRLRQAGADVIVLVANAPEGATIVRVMVTLGWHIPLVGHSGISASRFVELAGVEHTDGVLTLQTSSFLEPLTETGQAVLQRYHRRFGTRHVRVPIAVASAYDGVYLLVRAIRQAKTTQGPQVREALESLQPYDGLIKRYAPAFTPTRHEALLAADYLMAVWRDGRLVPAPQPHLRR